MLRISALEAQLDRYRHGLDEDAIVALEKSEAEERRMKEMALQEREAKEQEVGVGRPLSFTMSLVETVFFCLSLGNPWLFEVGVV